MFSYRAWQTKTEKEAFLCLWMVLLLPAVAVAAENDDAQAAYCKYVTEQASGQRDLLRSPSAVVGPIQPSTGTPPQMVFGISSSLADIKKAGLTMNAARATCALYSAATEAQKHIYYALPLIEKDVLRHRLDLISTATEQLDQMIASDDLLVASQNMTRPAAYYLRGARARLDLSRTAALTGITSPYVPPLSSVALRTLVSDALKAQEGNQKALVRLEKQSGWDIQVSGGVRRQLSQITPSTSVAGAYGTFSLSYDLGRHSANAHLDSSISAYMQWKESQFDDVARQAEILKKQIEETIDIQENQLKVLTNDDATIVKDLAATEGVETNTALSFKNQLLADHIVLQVEIADVSFRLERLRHFLSENF